MKKRIFASLLVFVMVLSLIGCSSGKNTDQQTSSNKTANSETNSNSETKSNSESKTTGNSGTNSESKQITIGISMCAIESQMWAEYQRAMHEACDKAGVKYTEAIAENDVQKQNQQIEDFIAQGVDAIIIAPADGEAVVAAIKKCNEANIPVIMANRAAGEGATVYATISSDNKAMVKREVKYIAENAPAGTKFKCLELVGSLTDVNAIARQQGFEEAIKEYPDLFELVATVPTEWKGELALSGVLNAFSANPDINLIFSPSDALLSSIESGLRQIDKWKTINEDGHITFITFDGAKEALAAIREGYVDIVSVQDATTQGQLCVEAAIDAANGKPAIDYIDPGFEVHTQNCNTDYADFLGY